MDYWEQIAELDTKISELTDALRENLNNKPRYDEIMDELYDLRQDKKRVQRARGKQLKQTRA